ncbi:AraC family transcriptional regulator [Achromobacter aloeverae]|uniref:AraC family transcriptional regulator n=1 Tax=Achromobacter aloeverae TaxID=1750518 RepID=A0A4Q1HF05_9BURK|nr:helix-turn-helix transcriptional regulator [Achromobacter aloeverae]RXN84429.1 AraC family transcriptional regulator [Achromobacter aloeverae]
MNCLSCTHRRFEDCQHTLRPLAAMASNHPDGDYIDRHSHRRGQLLHSLSGVMITNCEHGNWYVPAGCAIWIPCGIDHGIRISGPVQIRTVFVEANARASLPRRCEVIGVSSLLRAAIIAAVGLPLDYAPDSRAAHIMDLILDELEIAPRQSTRLPMPRHAKLAHLCARLLAAPALPLSLEDAARGVNISSRTLTRFFHRETGMSYTAWRRQSRILLSLPQLAEGASILRVALDHGYDSPSAFAAAFKRVLGVPPSVYAREDDGEPDGRPVDNRAAPALGRMPECSQIEQ